MESVDLLKTKLNAMHADVSTAKTKSDAASTNVAESVRELTAITMRVKILEERRWLLEEASDTLIGPEKGSRSENLNFSDLWSETYFLNPY